jgi:hypothetical protein
MEHAEDLIIIIIIKKNINNVRMKKNVTIQALLTTAVGHSSHINCPIMKGVMDKIFSLQLSWSADKLQPLFN